jgi:hypothetical protein
MRSPDLSGFRPDQEAKLVLILRTSNAQIGVQSATIDVRLNGQIGSLPELVEGLKGRVGRANGVKRRKAR